MRNHGRIVIFRFSKCLQKTLGVVPLFVYVDIFLTIYENCEIFLLRDLGIAGNANPLSC